MAEQVRTWLKHVSGPEDTDTSEAEKLVVRNDEDNITLELWDYEGKRAELTLTSKTAVVLARSVELCLAGSLGEITVNL
jgi:hypothetical protein